MEKSIESQTLLKSNSKTTQSNKDSDYYASKEYQNEISSKTKGQVKEYSVLSKNQENESKTLGCKSKSHHCQIQSIQVSSKEKNSSLAVSG